MIASSIVYFGPLTSKDKALLWKTLAEQLAAELSIEASKYWHIENECENGKLFKKLIEYQGHESLLFNLSHLYHENIFSEFLICYMFSPRTPYVFDSVGYCKDFLEDEMLLVAPSSVFASEYLIEEKLNYYIKELVRPVFLCDLTDYTSPIYGRIIDWPIL